MRHQLVLSAVIAGTTGQQALLTALLVLICGLLIVLIVFLLTQWSRRQADTPLIGAPRATFSAPMIGASTASFTSIPTILL